MMVDAMVLAATSVSAADDPEVGDEQVERVVRICAAALGLPRVGLHDNFFQLGGDSATATSVVEQLSQQASATATLRLLFENPVIGEFAAKLATDIEEGVL